MIRNFVPILKNKNYQSEKVTYIRTNHENTNLFFEEFALETFLYNYSKIFRFYYEFFITQHYIPLLTYLQDQ